MISFFPAIYPNELWYSVLCRYHIRAGHTKYQTTVKELFGKAGNYSVGTLIPTNSIYLVHQKLPTTYVSLQEIILKHTLFSYIVRFYPIESKKEMLNDLCVGKSMIAPTYWRHNDSKNWRMKYCPECVKEDRDRYGEAYWHREHQVPLVTCCTKHQCKLFGTHIDLYKASHSFSPLEQLPTSTDCDTQLADWEMAWNRTLVDYLEMPLEIGPTPGYNNIIQQIVNLGYRFNYSLTGPIFDRTKVYEILVKQFNEDLVRIVFGDAIHETVCRRMYQWSVYSPERFAMLQTFAGMKTSDALSETKLEDDMRLRFQKVADENQGKFILKKEVAKELHLRPSQLDLLSDMWHIKPFWNQLGEEKRKGVALKVYVNKEMFSMMKKYKKDLNYLYMTDVIQRCIDIVLTKEGYIDHSD